MVIYHKNLFKMNIAGCKISTTFIIGSLYKRKNGRRVKDPIKIIVDDWIRIYND